MSQLSGPDGLGPASGNRAWRIGCRRPYKTCRSQASVAGPDDQDGAQTGRGPAADDSSEAKMLHIPDTPAARAVRGRKPGYSLDAPFYTSPEIFEADMDDHLRPALDLCRRRARRAGARRRHDRRYRHDLRSSSCATTTWDVRAFHNVCRHRGARLIARREDDGRQHRLPLPFLDLRPRRRCSSTPSIWAPDFDRSCHGLKPVHVRSLEGLLFICLADDPPADFDDDGRGSWGPTSRRTTCATPRSPSSPTSSSRATGSSPWRTTASATTARATIPS